METRNQKNAENVIISERTKRLLMMKAQLEDLEDELYNDRDFEQAKGILTHLGLDKKEINTIAGSFFEAREQLTTAINTSIALNFSCSYGEEI